jgi:hypothetical protein
MRARSRRRWALAAAVAATAVPVAGARADTVATSAPLTPIALGVNGAAWDGDFSRPAIPGLLSAAKIGSIRYPGGSYADTFKWQTTTDTIKPAAFMGIAAASNAAPFITVNYGDTTQGPAIAAAWVTSAMASPGYSDATALWEPGNENYGTWENDTHVEPHTPQSYATNVGPYYQAMHAADPAAQLGFPYVLPIEQAAGTGTWVPDPAGWNKAVLSANAGLIDFADVHWYPVFGNPALTDADIMATVDRIPAAMQGIRATLDRYDPTASIIIGESNISQSSTAYETQPIAALYGAASALKFLSLGAKQFSWWDIHNQGSISGDFGFISSNTGTGNPVNTTVTAAAAAGARNLALASTAGFALPHTITIDTGAGRETRKVTAVAGATTLAAPAAAGDSNVKLASVIPFAPGSPIAIDTGAGVESRTVTAVGAPASATTLAAPAAAGDTNVKLAGTALGGQTTPVFYPAGIVPGAVLTIDTGDGAETATIKSLGRAATLGTTLVAPAAAGDAKLYVASVTNTSTGLANYVGDPIAIDTGASLETRTIADVGTSAGTATTLVLPAAAGDTKVYVANVTGDTAGHALVLDTGAAYEAPAIGSVGTAAPAQTTLSAAAAAGDTVIKVASVANLVAGHRAAVDTGANLEAVTISAVGTAGAGGTGVTLGAPLARAHNSAVAVRDTGTGVTLAAPLAFAHAAASAARDAGSGITLSAPLAAAHASGTATRDVGTGITLAAPLAKAHAGGVAATTPGTGVTLSAPLSAAHASGVAAASSGVTITPALTAGHAAGTAVQDPGIKEPAKDVPMPAYYGIKLTSLLTSPGAVVSDLGSPATGVLAFGSYGSGSESVMLINGSDSEWKSVAVGGLSGDVQTSAYSLENPAIATGTIAAATAASGLELAPESITVVTAAAATAPPVTIGAQGGVGGTVAATLSLTLGGPASFGAFTPGVAGDYTASTSANVISTAGDAALSVADPSPVATGHLVNGSFSLPSPLLVGGAPIPGVLKTWSAPVSNDPVTIGFSQHIGASDALRTGSYAKTLTFTLSTTTP